MNTRFNVLRRHLKRGRVYKRADLARWSKSVDRHLRALVAEGVLQKLKSGLYYFPKKSAFGIVPPTERELVRVLLGTDQFLLSSPNAFNELGVGTTQLYNAYIVYNHTRHGHYQLGGISFEFRRKERFPRKLTDEFLLVELVNNIDSLAENTMAVLARARVCATKMDARKLHQAVRNYGKRSTRKFFETD